MADHGSATPPIGWRRSLKRAFIVGVTRGPLGAVLKVGAGPVATVFMLHRFEDRAIGNHGTPVAAIEENLVALKAMGATFMTLHAMVEALSSGAPLPPRAVAFTVDDGYHDILTVGAPTFERLGVPMTVFITTGFVARQQWQWWDRVEVAFDMAGSGRVELPAAAGGAVLTWTPETSFDVSRRAVLAIEFLPGPERDRAIADIERQAGVTLPPVPTPRYASLTWDDVRALERRGIDFAPHTLTHPILTRVDAATSRHEIEESWAELRRQVERPVPVFCYPNGTEAAVSPRETEFVRQAGMTGAVIAEPGYASDATRDEIMMLRRFPLGDRPEAEHHASGFWRYSSAIRRSLFGMDTTHAPRSP